MAVNTGLARLRRLRCASVTQYNVVLVDIGAVTLFGWEDNRMPGRK